MPVRAVVRVPRLYPLILLAASLQVRVPPTAFASAVASAHSWCVPPPAGAPALLRRLAAVLACEVVYHFMQAIEDDELRYKDESGYAAP